MTTKLSADEITDRLDEQIEPKDFFRLSIRGHRRFEGKVISNKFSIQMIGHGNSFRPKITGTIIKEINGTIISIRVRMTIYTYIFMAIWLGTVTVAGSRILFQQISKGQFQSSIFLILLFFGFGYGLMMWGFKSESLDTKKFLATLLEGVEVNDKGYT